MVKTNLQHKQLTPHPHIPGWNLGLLTVSNLVDDNQTRPIDISQDKTPEVRERVYIAVEQAPEKTVIGIDLRGISLMSSKLWRQLAPKLHKRVLEGELGADKRILFITEGKDELLLNLQSWFLLESKEASSTTGGKLVDQAGIVPAATKGYCGFLRLAYEEVFLLVNSHGSLSNEDVVELVNNRYSFNNANNYLTALADLGLVYRQLTPRTTGGYASRAYALSVSEEVMDEAVPLV